MGVMAYWLCFIKLLKEMKNNKPEFFGGGNARPSLWSNAGNFVTSI